MVVTGNEAIIRYAKEASFGKFPVKGGDGADANDPNPDYKSWGLSQKISGLTSTEGHKPQMDVGTATVTEFTYGGRTRDFNLEWIMSEHEFFEYLLGPVKGNKYEYQNLPTYFTQEIAIARAGGKVDDGAGNLVDSDYLVRTLKGCVLNSWSMSYGIEGEVKCNASVKCGVEDEPTSKVGKIDPPTRIRDPFTFDHAKVMLTGDAAIAKVQSVELSVNPNHQLVRTGGNAQAVDGHKQLLEITGKISMTLEKGVNLAYLIKRQNDAMITIMLNNLSDKMITMVLKDISFPAHALSAIEANALILEDVSFQAKTIEVSHAP